MQVCCFCNPVQDHFMFLVHGAFCNYHQFLAGVDFQILSFSELELGGKREDMFVHH